MGQWVGVQSIADIKSLAEHFFRQNMSSYDIYNGHLPRGICAHDF